MESKNSSNENRKCEIRIVCAWCGKNIGEKDGKGVEGISHGLCRECLAGLRVKIEKNGAKAGNANLK